MFSYYGSARGVRSFECQIDDQWLNIDGTKDKPSNNINL